MAMTFVIYKKNKPIINWNLHTISSKQYAAKSLQNYRKGA